MDRWLSRNTEGLHQLVVMALETAGYPDLSGMVTRGPDTADGRHGPLLDAGRVAHENGTTTGERAIF